MIYPTLPQSIAIIVAFTAMLTDSSSGRIYNWLTFPAILAGWLVNFYLSGLDGFGLSLAGTFAGIFLYLPFAAINLLGMGDVKLLGGIGALGGPWFALSVFLYTSALGVVHALIVQFLNYGTDAAGMTVTSFTSGAFRHKTIHSENASAARDGRYRFLLGIDIFIATLIACYHTLSITW
ncbi:A24 family peptidase [Erysipelotrichia bacterium]